MKKKLIISSLLLALILPAISTQAALKKESPKEIWLTVFVHGIMSIRNHLSTTNFIRFMKDKIEDTIYAKTVEFMRLEKYFYLNQAMQGVGLHPLDISIITKNGAPAAIAYIYDQMSKLAGSPNAQSLYYTFGWSGLLSPSRRYKESNDLFMALEKEVAQLKSQGFDPKVRLIGYSHGGNILLNLAATRRDKYPKSTLSVDELILIGVPIQVETDYLINDPIFKKIYHFYSPHDRIQQIDIFSFNRFFSRKFFVNRRNFKLPKKLMQIELKFVRTVKTKGSNAEKYRNLTMNFDDPQILSGTSRLLRNVSPGHIELWFFGWSPQNYRRNFIFSPLPALVAIPHVLHAIKQVESDITNPFRVIADVRPDHEVVIIKQYKPEHVAHVLPFATKEQIKQMADIAYSSKPDQYNGTEYNNYLYNSLERATCHFLNNIVKDKIDPSKILSKKRSRRRITKKRARCLLEPPQVIAY